ncbi:MAG: hypothetical protein GF353_09825 [Candidatus Lokiarchaeota archaeon]|nr:hypothetical protein [Candidatus Lokiarchaeota archaeon]
MSGFLFWIFFIFKQLPDHVAKFIFAIASNFLGASIYGYEYRIRSKSNPFPKYLVHYPITIIAFSGLSFGVVLILLSSTNISLNIVFYLLVFFMGIYCGQHIDNIKELGSILKGTNKNP